MNGVVRETPLHLNIETGRYWYRKIAREEVPTAKLLLSADVVRVFAADLDLVDLAPQIIWVRPEDWHTGHDEVSRAGLHEFQTGEPYACCCFNEAEDFSGYTPYESFRDIYIRVDLPEPGLITIIAHELRHLWQSKTYGSDYRRNHDDEMEVDAASYAADAVERYQAQESGGATSSR